MNKILSTLLLLAAFGSKAQTLSNPNFESWGTGSTVSTTYYTDTLPTNWWPFYCNTVHQTTDSYQGIYASKIQGWFACGIAPGIMVNGKEPINYGEFIESGTPFTTKPSSISGYYKYTDVTMGDSAEVTIILKRYNSVTMKRDTIAYSTQTLPASATYSLYTVNIIDLMPGVMPDSIIIMFNSSKYYMFDPITMALPALYIDRIAMPETPMSIADNQILLMESSVYPNPFSESATLVMDAGISQFEHPSVQIYDLSGKKVMDLGVITSKEVVFNQGNLSKGSYFYQVSNGNALISQGKFIVQ